MQPRRRIWIIVAFLGAGAAAETSQQPQFTDPVDVSRIVVDARALDDNGRAILGLSADEFTVKIHDKPARVESATWVGAGSEDSAEAAPGIPEGSLPRGRLIVFLFQKDLEPSRIIGLMRML